MASNNTRYNSTKNLFLDNTIGDITASDLRAFVDNIFIDSEVKTQKFKSIVNFESGDVSNVYEGTLVLFTEEDKGLYISLSNQPASISLLVKIAGDVNDSSSLDRNSLDYIAGEGQYLFAAEYRDNYVDVFVDGKKIADSNVITNSTETTNGSIIALTTALIGEEKVEIVCFK